MENNLIHIAVSANTMASLTESGCIHAVDFKCLDIAAKKRWRSTDSCATSGQSGVLARRHPSLNIGSLLESRQHDLGDILRESLESEDEALKAYYELLNLVKDKSIRLEEYARDMIVEEIAHQDEVNKMLRKPGQTEAFSVN